MTEAAPAHYKFAAGRDMGATKLARQIDFR